MRVTLSSKVNRQGHVILFNMFDFLDLENVRIDTKINFVSCLQPEMRKVMQKGVWPWFSRSCNKDRIFSVSPLDSLAPKTYPWEIFSKISDVKAKIQGGCIPLRLWRNTLGVCWLNHSKFKLKLIPFWDTTWLHTYLTLEVTWGYKQSFPYMTFFLTVFVVYRCLFHTVFENFDFQRYGSSHPRGNLRWKTPCHSKASLFFPIWVW